MKNPKPKIDRDCRDHKLAKYSLVEAMREAEKYEVEVREIEKKIFDIMTSDVGMKLSCLQVRLAEIKPKYESALQQTGSSWLWMSKTMNLAKKK